MSAMANTTPIVTTVTKPATKEKTPKDADATPRVNIQDFYEEHYEDILPVIMDKIRRDKRKEVHARLAHSTDLVILIFQAQLNPDRIEQTLEIVLTVEAVLIGRTRLTEIVLEAEIAHAALKNYMITLVPPMGRGPNMDIARATETAPAMRKEGGKVNPRHLACRRAAPAMEDTRSQGDPEDHVKNFQAAAQVERWAMPTWCHIFNSTLIGAARYIKDPVEIHNIKQRDGETIEEFMERFKVETRRMKGAPECMRISRFMHGVNNPELTKRLNEHVPKTMEEMMIATTAFIRGEAAANGKKRGERSTKGREKEVPAKDKSMAIYMIQPWHRVTRQKVTQSFERVSEITFPSLITSSGTEGPLVIEAEIGGHMIYRMYVDGATTLLTGFSGETIWPLGQLRLLVTIGDADHSTKAWINFMIVRSLSPYNGIIGRPGIREIQAVPSIAHKMLKFPFDGGIVTIRSTILIPVECATVLTSSKEIPKEAGVRHENFKVAPHPNFPDQEVAIVGTLSARGRTKLCSLLKENLDIFAWQPSDMTGVPRSIAEHRLNIREGYSPVRQKKRGQAPERTKAIQTEVHKLVEVGIMREVYYHEWLSNPVMVKKHDGSWRMCVDFTDLNKACLQDWYPLPEIIWKVKSLCGYPFKCFLDAYKGYHQIQMAEPDEDKTAFHTSQGVYCYTKMPFGLKNAGATYQQLVDKAFDSQVGRNIEVYVDDLVIKSHTEAEMLRDIDETFCTLWKINMKLNPKKCMFGAVEGMFLGYLISPEGIKPCLDKTKVVLQLPSPRTIKEVQSLNGKLASLNRFLSKSAKRSLPLFKFLKKCIKNSDFHWTPEAEQAFKQLKQHLSELPLLVAPKPNEELIIYMSASHRAISTVLMTERGTVQTPVYFVSRALQGLELNYIPMEKLVLSLVFAAKRLRRYFQAHPIAILADFLIEKPDESPPDTLVVEIPQDPWTLFTDESSCVDKSGAGLILTSPKGTEFTYALRFWFTAYNNEAEYEALIASLRIAAHMGVHNVHDPPGDRKEASKLRIKARQYELLEGVLYRRSFLKPWLRCVGPLQADYVIREIHEGSCSMHAGPRSVVAKAMQLGYYWPTMHRDARDMIRTCNDFQIHHPVPRNPQQPLTPITAPWPFYKWGIDIAGPFPEGPGKVKKFVWDNIVCRFGLSGEIVSDNGKQFSDNPLEDWCEKLNITQCFVSVKHPQSNGLVERANRSLGEGIKARLGEGNKNWIEELPHVLWAHRTMIKSSHGDTPFSLTYGTEAVIPAKIGMPTYRIAVVDAVHNDEELRLNLDLLEERHERAAIREAKAKLKMTKDYNARVRGVTLRPGDFVYRSNDASHAADGGKVGLK
ncbi:reverse transcriptase domain-containing protein [Tanacetum coccineum]